MTYLSAETIYFIRKVLNPMPLFRKVPFQITNNNTEDVEPDGTYNLETQKDPEIFDNPMTQTVIFDHEPVNTKRPLWLLTPLSQRLKLRTST